MKPDLQRRVQRYGWDKAAEFYEKSWHNQLKPAHDLLIDLSQIQANEHILDLAAGTGLVTFRMAEKTGPGGKVLATDISDEMIKLGSEISQAKKLSNVSFERMDAEQLLLPDNSFNLVTCALGLMYVPDPDAALAEMYRVLKPGGRTVAAVWGSRKKCGWAEIFPIVDARVSSDVCPMFFNLGENEVLKFAFEKAGFKKVTSKKIDTKLRYSSADEACEASFLGGPVALAYSRFDEETKNEAKKDYVKSIEAFKTENGYEIAGEFIVCYGFKE